MNPYATILTALVELRADIDRGKSPVTGICHAVSARHYELLYTGPFKSDLLDFAVREWPGFSGNRVYPVPCNRRDPEAAYDAYARSNKRGWWLWESPKYGMKRRELLDFLIMHFEGKVNASS